MFLAAPHKRKAENASLEDDKLLEQLMKSKGLNVDDDDDEESIPRANPQKKQKSEVRITRKWHRIALDFKSLERWD